jgi:hypothetical protein
VQRKQDLGASVPPEFFDGDLIIDEYLSLRSLLISSQNLKKITPAPHIHLQFRKLVCIHAPNAGFHSSPAHQFSLPVQSDELRSQPGLVLDSFLKSSRCGIMGHHEPQPTDMSHSNGILWKKDARGASL